jgi:hypothetical protein
MSKAYHLALSVRHYPAIGLEYPSLAAASAAKRNTVRGSRTHRYACQYHIFFYDIHRSVCCAIPRGRDATYNAWLVADPSLVTPPVLPFAPPDGPSRSLYADTQRPPRPRTISKDAVARRGVPMECMIESCMVPLLLSSLVPSRSTFLLPPHLSVRSRCGLSKGIAGACERANERRRTALPP